MISIRDYVYRIEGDMLNRINIKFYAGSEIDKANKIIYYDNDYLVYMKGTLMIIFNIDNQKFVTIDLVEFVHNKYTVNHVKKYGPSRPLICGIIDDHIIFESSDLGGYGTMIYNLVTGEYVLYEKCGIKFKSILKGRQFIVHGIRLYYGICYFFDSIAELHNILDYDDKNYKHLSDSILLLWMYDKQIIGINFAWGSINWYITYINVYDPEMILIRSINITKYSICVDSLCNMYTNIAQFRNNIYVWSTKYELLVGCWMLIINQDAVVRIENYPKVRLYNCQYDVFVNDRLETFKIINNKFVRFRFEYDLLRDVNKPYVVQCILDVLIELDLFPIELCNVVYQQLIYNMVLKN